MRWMWIDRVVELDPGRRLVAIKNVSLAEEHLHDHFPAIVGGDGALMRHAMPIMPASLIIEGVAQSAGILVGHAQGFREKVILAKVSKATIERDATPGCQLRYTADVKTMSDRGASTSITIELGQPGKPFETIGTVEMMFSNLDQNMAGTAYPEHNFVFGEAFRTLLRSSGVPIPGE